MEFNKRGFELFRKDVEVALQSVAEKHGVEIECGKISYSSFDLKMMVTQMERKRYLNKNVYTLDLNQRIIIGNSWLTERSLS